MKYLHYEFDLTNSLSVRVILENQANVKLLTSSDYFNYRNGRKYHYYGGLAEKSPIVLKAPYSGHWHLVIDLGGYTGTISASVCLIKN